MGENKAKVLFIFRKTFGIIELFLFWIASCLAFGIFGIDDILSTARNACSAFYHNFMSKIIPDLIGSIAVVALALIIVLVLLIIMLTRGHTSFFGLASMIIFIGTGTFALVKGKSLNYFWTLKRQIEVGGHKFNSPFYKIFVICYFALVFVSLIYFVLASIYTSNESKNVVYMNAPEETKAEDEEKETRVKKPAIIVNGKVELGAEIQILAYGHEAYAKVTEYDGETLEQEEEVPAPAIVQQTEVVEEPVEETVPAEESIEEPVEEPIVEEEPTEEPIVEEEPIEEPIVEDSAEENEEIEDEDEEENDDEENVELVVDQNGVVIPKINKVDFDEKVEKASDDLKRRYNEIKSVIMQYKNVHDRLSKSGDSFRCKGQKYVFISIIGKTLKVYLAVDPFSIDQNVYHHRDVSNKKKYQVTPTLIRVKSDLSCKKTIKLIEVMFEDNMIDKKKKIEKHDYVEELLKELEAKKQTSNN